MSLPSSYTLTGPVPQAAREHFVTTTVHSEALRPEARRALESGEGCTIFVGFTRDGARVETLVSYDTGRAVQVGAGAPVHGLWCEHGDEGHIELDLPDAEGRTVYAALDGSQSTDPLLHRTTH